MSGGATAGSGRTFRLDPHLLPARGPNPGSVADADFIIENGQAFVRRQRTGPATAVPLASYRGVAVRMEPMPNASIRVRVELLHSDPALTLPLVVADEPEQVAADWQAWGRTLNLPLLVIGQDGSVSHAFDRLGSITVCRPKPRRRHSFFAGRRPRFLSRRKVGRKGQREHLAGREIIARN